MVICLPAAFLCRCCGWVDFPFLQATFQKILFDYTPVLIVDSGKDDDCHPFSRMKKYDLESFH